MQIPWSDIKKMILHEECLHPQAALRDFYKLCFQSAFGPGHIISSADQARSYILTELSQSEEYDPVLFQPLQGLGQFCRVNLRLVTDNLIEVKDLTEILLLSSKQTSIWSKEEWFCLWKEIERWLIENFPTLNNDNEKKLIAKVINTDSRIMSHSDSYRKLYNPHYRVVLTEVINRYLSLEDLCNLKK